MREGKPMDDFRPFHEFPRAAEEARSQGETFYFDGKKCRNGHWSVRYASIGGQGKCLQCRREKEQRQNEKTKEEHGVTRRSRNRALRKARLRAQESGGNAS